MDAGRYEEMKQALYVLEKNGAVQGKEIFLFGHCEATLKLIDLLFEKGFSPRAILDNNPQKWDVHYREIPICAPETIVSTGGREAVVLVVSRFYEAMYAQLRKLGYQGEAHKLLDYNSFAEYTLSAETIQRKRVRAERGVKNFAQLKSQYPGAFFVFCPFRALGDVYLAMSYLPAFLEKHHKSSCVICVVGRACGEVARLFGHSTVVEMTQTYMDETVQGVIYTQDSDCFIAHQDRPYVVKLHRALYLKCIPLDTIYCCGVFGLQQGTPKAIPTNWRRYDAESKFDKGRAVILSPHAKSVTALPEPFWDKVVKACKEKGLQVLTNVNAEEKPLPGTQAISPDISKLKSAVEQAGMFIGIRSGLCDVLQTASCRKIALYPDYFYSDTRWKAIDMYALPGFDNFEFDGGLSWLSF